MEKIIREAYFSINSPASFAGANKVLKEAQRKDPRIKLEDVQAVLEKEPSYTLYKSARKRFPRLKTHANGYLDHFQCDLADFREFKEKNDGYGYLLVCVDILSRKFFVAPCKTKSSDDVIEAFEEIFKQTEGKRYPREITSDRGKEFTANKVMSYFESKNIQKHVTFNLGFHAGVVERANRTIKERLYRYLNEKGTTRWIDVVHKIVNNINNSVNRTTGVTPNSVNFENSQEIYERLYKDDKAGPSNPKFKKGDYVRYSLEKGVFEKSYYANYTDELFRISEVHKTHPPYYSLVDLLGEEILGKFYQNQLVKAAIDSSYHRVAEVLKERTIRGKKEFFVRWLGYSDKHNSWVKEKDIVR